MGVRCVPELHVYVCAQRASVWALVVDDGSKYIHAFTTMAPRDVYEFADVVRAWGPKKRRELEAWLGVKVRSVRICLCGWWWPAW